MSDFQPRSKTISVTFARRHFFKILDDVYFNHTQYIITKHKIPLAVLVHPDDSENKRFSLAEFWDKIT